MTLAGREMPIPATFYGGTDNSAFQRHLVAGFYTKVDQIAKRNSCVYLRSHSLIATFCILFTNLTHFSRILAWRMYYEYITRANYFLCGSRNGSSLKKRFPLRTCPLYP